MEIWLNRARKEEKLAFMTQARKVIKGYKPGRVIGICGNYYKVKVDGKIYSVLKTKNGFKRGYEIFLKRYGRGFRL